MPDPTPRKSYKDTLNLPRTSFAMKANLVQNEPASLKRWQQTKLYERIRAARRGSPRGRYVFHDGPPYANGLIHIGHLLNKAMKDFVVRSRTMMGYDCPFTPGWDCHGQPIEHKVVSELGDKARAMVPVQIRKRCQDSAARFIKLQMAQMQRLLTLADYDRPYVTMDPAYEAGVLEVFADMLEKGLVYRALKPVHWSIANRTALAEAELEYYDREDTSVYVLFEVADARKLPAAIKAPAGQPVHLMIWTTTPWTLPANLAVAVHPRLQYGLYEFTRAGRPERALLVDELAAKVLAGGGAAEVSRLGGCAGAELAAAGLQYRHPFCPRTSPVLAAEYVTVEDGTGLVHTAPGHGVEDYQTGKKHGLPIYCPVRDDGTFDDTVPEWLRAPGVDVWQANDLVVRKLRDSGHLFHAHKFTHSYPHDWRGKSPVIFRATEQWFVGVDQAAGSDSLRRMALGATESGIDFIPAWGRNRMRGMLESRPDWCLSRQRSWGLPIPAFYAGAAVTVPAGQPNYLLTAASVRAVMAVVRKQGADAWFRLAPAELLAGYDPAGDPAAPAWAAAAIAACQAQGPGTSSAAAAPPTANQPPAPQAADLPSRLSKGADIFDVWFESGCSWNAALARMQDGDFPADLYLEGSDQHRGWFQVSLLCGLASRGRSPFKQVLTHGWTVDKDGHKMSKSLGNTIEVEDLLKELGADVCRWWVCATNTENDIKVDMGLLREAGEEYRKVRNTLRFLLSNLADFRPAEHGHRFSEADAASVDAWALGELNKLTAAVVRAYERHDFPQVRWQIHTFCNDAMSAVYLAATKDRLYCDRPDSPRRRRTQTAMHRIADTLIRLLAPVLPHTADEAWAALHGVGQGLGTTGATAAGAGSPASIPDTVHLALFPEPVKLAVDPGWATVMASRQAWLKAVEEARQGQGIDNPLDCGLRVASLGQGVEAANFSVTDLADLCMVSRFAVDSGLPGPRVDDLRAEPRCDRSWKRDGTVKPRSDGGLLSERDAAAIGVA